MYVGEVIDLDHDGYQCTAELGVTSDGRLFNYAVLGSAKPLRVTARLILDDRKYGRLVADSETVETTKQYGRTIGRAIGSVKAETWIKVIESGSKLLG